MTRTNILEWYCKDCNSYFDKVDLDEGFGCAFCDSENIEPYHSSEESVKE